MRGEERSLLTAPKAREDPIRLIRLEFPHHPRPPQRELRERGVFDSGGDLIGYVANVYVDEERNYRFVDIAVGGFKGLNAKHHLVPVEAIALGEPGSLTLRVDRQTLESAPTLGNPHEAPDEDLQRAARERCE
jgi:PRC-barrel domain